MKLSFQSLFIILLITFLSCGQENRESKEIESDTTDSSTTYYFIRHAEKDRSDPNNSNPDLTQEGIERAQNWAKELSHIEFDAIYSTNYNRTQQTAEPLAKQNNLEVILYDANSLNNSEFQKNTKGKTVMVVGHSNTSPFFANAVLGEKKYEEMADDNNGAIYIVTVKDGKATSELRQIN